MTKQTSNTRHDRKLSEPGPYRAAPTTWKASAYDVDLPAVRAAEDARWERREPFASYRPPTVGWDAQAGPHLDFARLKEAVRDLRRDPAPFAQEIYRFASRYGLLGLFWEDYPAGPVLPFGKQFVAPEALVDVRGLRRLDPATEGRDLLLKLHGRKDDGHDEHFGELRAVYETAGVDPVALPSELVVFPQIRGNLPRDGSGYRPVPWDEAKQAYDAVLVLDGRSYTGVSVLCRSEPLDRWITCLDLFPFPDSAGEPREHPITALDGELSLPDSSDEYLLASLIAALQGTVSPRPFAGGDGRLEQGWWCRNLLSALYLMLYLDKTGGAEYRRCDAPDCGRLFRRGPGSKRVYCPHPDDPSKPSKCGSRDTSRRSRERQRQRS